jgi:hypothetical protein
MIEIAHRPGANKFADPLKELSRLLTADARAIGRISIHPIDRSAV